jgi:hypothetical protein
LFAGRVAEKIGVADATVLAQFKRSFTSKTPQNAPVLPNFAELKKAERDLVFALVHHTREAMEAVLDLDQEDLEYLAGRDIFDVARSLHDLPAETLPATLLQRLSTVSAQLVTSIAATHTAPAPPTECARAIKRLRWERERAAIQREIDRLQELGATQHGREIDNLWQRKKDLLHRIEDLT